MRKPRDSYTDFQERIFQEIGELEETRNKLVWEQGAAQYGLTMDDVLKLYSDGMNGRELLEAMRTNRKN